MNTRWLGRAILSCWLGGAGSASGDYLTFTAYDVGSLGCPESGAIAYDINDLGVVVGITGAPPCPPTDGHGFAWFNGAVTDLEETSGGVNINGANHISDTRHVIGGTGGSDLVVVLSDGVVWEIAPAAECDINGFAQGMNGAGTMIVGECRLDTGDGSWRAAVYWTNDGHGIALDLLPDSPPEADSIAEDVNDSGVVVGRITHVDGNKGFIWSDGVITELPNTLGGNYSNAYTISDTGIIGGGAETDHGWHAMTYDMNTGLMTELGEGTVYGVNDRGDAVGDDIIDLMGFHAMLYKDGQAIDLQPFLPDYMPDSTAWAINRYGWIVGEALLDPGFVWYGWLLVPIYDKGDYDGDGDVDLQDSGHFQRCFAAEDYIDGTLHVGCSVFDFDDNNDLDLTDYAAFQSAFAGPTAPNNNPNGPG